MRELLATLTALAAMAASCSSDDDPGASNPRDGGADASAATGGRSGSSGNAGTAGAGGRSSTGGVGGAGGAGGASGAGNAGGTVGSSGTSGTGGATGGSGGLDGSAPGRCTERPSANNTGVRPGVTLTPTTGDVTVTQDGTTLEAQDIHGFLVIRASRVTIRNCRVRGGPTSSNGAGLRVQSGSEILVEDTEIGLDAPSVYLDAVTGSNLTVRRANIHGGVDGMKLGSNSSVECSYIHDMASFASDPNQGGGPTHNDAIQILSGTNIRVLNNVLVVTKSQNAAIQVTQDFGHVGDLTVTGNFADGGGCTFNFSHNGGTDLTGVTVTDNRFGRNSFYDCPMLKSTKTTLVMSGNVWDDDGTPAPIQTHD